MSKNDHPRSKIKDEFVILSIRPTLSMFDLYLLFQGRISNMIHLLSSTNRVQAL